jgi:protein-S-isoprenylcysteine O-methyltransferase Ste14
MNTEETFRSVLIVICLIVFPIALYHRLRSQATREKLDRMQEGWFILATLRPAGLAFLVGLIAYMRDPRSMSWSSMSLPVALRWTGLVLCAAAAGWLTWTLRHLGKNLTDTVVTRRHHTLVTTGPYRWVRHPFYDAVGLLVAGTSLLAANWFLVTAGGTLLIMIVIRTRREEERLLARFGEAYRDYMARTGRFLPRIDR